MKEARHYSRNIDSLSNDELIKLVDFIFIDYNLDRLAHSLFDQKASLSRSITYRKIEVVYSEYDWAYILKITFRLDGFDKLISTGFIIASDRGFGEEKNTECDIYIQSVSAFYRPFENIVHPQGFGNTFGIDLDFSIFILYQKRLYQFLNNSLQMWSDSLPEDKYSGNPQIQALLEIKSYIVQEVHFTLAAV